MCRSKSIIDRVIKMQYKMKKNKRVRVQRRNGYQKKFRAWRRNIEKNFNKVN